ncbi:4'-phosphopantetheinyl transferase family protein [Bacillus gaemokensis]|uniref:4'-phosphopantetheinyl transferase n=1 Tax=Bacillus gaemokensis TaxID=574375 RepID=A0A073KNQ1_9BACI|nr:4'-phosphopantetheinyl transferase superfamily protein [Bacillus gaemokensis]KEK23978.1 4'-phosphopantetheinyl transferase [Bacillus gaemokensis]KYG27182.1 4'-phosphopantetheinyl transferase [Bacillus gaemokensis]
MKGWEIVDSVPELSGHQCQVWWARISDLQSWHYRLLNETEREKANLFHHSEDRVRFIIGCAISRLVLGKLLSMSPLQVPIDRTCSVCKLAHGRPQLPVGMPQLSVSHSGKRVAVAFTTSTLVGIDVEQINSNIDVLKMATGVLTDIEIAQLMQMPVERQVEGFLTYWTRKEAILKATGEGLMISPSNLTVSTPEQLPELFVFKDKPKLVETTTMMNLQPGLGYIASVALLNKDVTEMKQFDAGTLLQSSRLLLH